MPAPRMERGETLPTLTEDEQTLFHAIEAGETAAFSQTPEDRPPHDVHLLVDKPEAQIRAAVLRRLLFGFPVQPGAGAQARPVKFTDYGLRLSGVQIIEELDLDDAGSVHQPPRLEFRHCWFDEPIHLRRSRLKSFTLAKCYFQELLATDSVVDGPVDISFARSSANPAKRKQCWVVMAGSRIAGRLNFARSHFMAPEKRSDYEWVRDSKHPRYALDLRGVQILGSVQIRPDVKAEGGICLTLAQVEGSVWCNGATLTGIEDAAFAADYASVKGSIYMRPYEHPNEPTVTSKDADESGSYESVPIYSKALEARGAVSLFAAKVGGSVYMAGARLTPLPQSNQPNMDEKLVFEASNAVIGGHCTFNCWCPNGPGRKIYRFQAVGRISLESARINNDLTFSGAHVEEIQASNLQVGGNCRMSVHTPDDYAPQFSFRCTKSVTLSGAVIKGTLKMNGAKIGSWPSALNDPDIADIGADFLAASGSANLQGLADPPKERVLIAISLDVGGNCELSTESFKMDKQKEGDSISRFQCFGHIVMREAKIGNSFQMNGSMIVGDSESVALDLAGASIGGQASFNVYSDKHKYAFELMGGKTGVRLTGAKIGDKLTFNGASIQAREVALNGSNLEVGGKASFATYAGKRFSAQGQMQLSSSSIKLGLYFVGAKVCSTLAAKPCLDLSLAKLKTLKLMDEKAGFPFEAAGKVCLEGADVESDIEIEGSVFDGPLNLEHVHAHSSVIFRDVEFRADAARDRKLAGEGALTKGSLDQHMRRDPNVVYLAMRAAKISGELQVDSLRVGGGDEDDRITVDLRSARVEELNDFGGSGWGQKARLWLEGFSYARLAEVDEKRSKHTFRKRRCRVFNPTWLPAAENNEDGEGYGMWETRLQWLQRQYFDAGKPRKGEFQPGAYEQVVSSWNNTGSFDDARRINSAKLSDGSQERVRLSRGFMWLFRLFFDFGLSANRAVLTFVLCIGIGWGAVALANGELNWLPGLHNFTSVLVANLGAPQTVLSEELKEKALVHRADKDAKMVSAEELPCGKRIKPFLYALDVFVPVLDLRQQASCSIAAERVGWRYAQAIYAVIGWIFTPLMFLSVTGILRRHLEK